jgi:hypothetical protein
MKKLFLITLTALSMQGYADIEDMLPFFQEAQAQIDYGNDKTYAVRVTETTVDGIKLHTAVYASQCTVLTALNGTDKGLQVMLDSNGDLVCWSRLVEWKKDKFTHTYPDGIVVSTKKQQYFEIY